MRRDGSEWNSNVAQEVYSWEGLRKAFGKSSGGLREACWEARGEALGALWDALGAFWEAFWEPRSSSVGTQEQLWKKMGSLFAPSGREAGPKKPPEGRREPKKEENYTGARLFGVSGGPKTNENKEKYKSKFNFNLKVAMCMFIREFSSESCAQRTEK